MIEKMIEQVDKVNPRFEHDPRVKTKANWLRQWIKPDDAINLLAMYMVVSDLDEELTLEQDGLIQNLTTINTDHVAALQRVRKIVQIFAAVAIKAIEKNADSKAKASIRGRTAAIAKDKKEGGSESKRLAIRSSWASGKYTSREVCAEQECAGLNMAFGTARRALRNTPNPPTPTQTLHRKG